MAVEALFPMDLLMDACILAAVQVALDRPCLRRLVRALLILLGTSMLHLLHPKISLPLSCAAFPLAALALLGRRRSRAILEAALALFCGYAACAGFMVLWGRRLLPALAFLIFFAALLYRRRHSRSNWNIEVILEQGGCKSCFIALIDTGNRLRERASGLPVLIVEERILGRALTRLERDACIPIPYGVLGGCGEIQCFKPDRLDFRAEDGRLVPAPECLVGIFPSHIPGSTRALAPPEFACCSPQAAAPLVPINNFCRRFYHGVFKHKAIHLWPGGTNSQGIGMLHRRQ